MAHIAWVTGEKIDQYLAYLCDEFDNVEDVANEWKELNELDHLDFRLEWPIKAERLHALERYAQEGVMTDEQLVRYRALLRRTAIYLPIIDRLLTGT